jgi:zinc protease
VRDFFFRYYIPNNAILVVAGNVTTDQVKKLSGKWFGSIPQGNQINRILPEEPKQRAKKQLTVEADVPADALYKAYHMPGRFDADFYAIDLLGDILGRGQSSRLYDQLVKENEIFTSVSAFTMGSVDPGLLVISGRLKNGVGMKQAEEAVMGIVEDIINNGVSEEELEKVKAQAESSLEFGEVEVMNRAMNLAFAKLSGDANLVNQEGERINNVTTSDIQRVAKDIIQESNSGALYYKARVSAD